MDLLDEATGTPTLRLPDGGRQYLGEPDGGVVEVRGSGGDPCHFEVVVGGLVRQGSQNRPQRGADSRRQQPNLRFERLDGRGQSAEMVSTDVGPQSMVIAN